MTEFKAFTKIARFSRDVIVSEKIDGTNGQVYIGEDGEFLVGSRERWITPEDDNHGFAKWAYAHREELMLLGPGRHAGEWWGSGINRAYGLRNDDKRFSLFNTIRWCRNDQEPARIPTEDPRIVKMQTRLPACVGLVPVLWTGNFDALDLPAILDDLRRNGSRVVDGFMRAEGVVVFHIAGNVGFKKTLERDDLPKSVKERTR